MTSVYLDSAVGSGEPPRRPRPVDRFEMSQVPPAQRSPALDALRGLAALVVVFGHALNLTGPGRLGWDRVLDLTPLGLITDGHLAVILFFLLSGFVLTRMLNGGSSADLAAFYLRRFTRLYPPFLVVSLAAWAAVVLSVQTWPQFTVSWNAWAPLEAWPAPLGLILLRGFSHDLSVNSTLWTLLIEFHVSLVIPPLVFAIRKGGGVATGLLIALSLTCGRLFNLVDPGQPLMWASNGVGRLLVSAYYIQDFAVGIFLAQSLNQFRRAFLQLPAAAHIVIAAFLFGVPCAYLRRHVAQQDAMDLLRSSYLILAVFAWPAVARQLASPVTLWLGKVSFSLYLVHLPVMFLLEYLLHDELSLFWVVALSLPVSLLAAELSQRGLEAPALRWSRRLGAWLRSGQGDRPRGDADWRERPRTTQDCAKSARR